MLEQALTLQNSLTVLRRQIHAHPELSFCETQTAALVARELESYGFHVQTGVGGTGVVADRGEGVTVALRADMDALPLTELNRTAYTSTVPAVMHACGHDAHVAIVLGAAQLLSQVNLPGKVRIVMQPAEEACNDAGRTGACELIEAGVLDGVAAILGLHVDATIPCGQAGLITGPISAAKYAFSLELRTLPDRDQHADVVRAAIDLADKLYALPQAKKDSSATRVRLGSLRTSGNHADSLSEWVAVRGLIRTFEPELQEQLSAMIRQMAEEVAGDRLEYKFDFENAQPPMVNDPAITAVMQQAAQTVLGARNVLSLKRKTWVDDFSLYTERVPGAFLFLGAEISQSRRVHHTPTFDIDERCLPLGSAVLAQTVMGLFASGRLA